MEKADGNFFPDKSGGWELLPDGSFDADALPDEDFLDSFVPDKGLLPDEDPDGGLDPCEVLFVTELADGPFGILELPDKDLCDALFPDEDPCSVGLEDETLFPDGRPDGVWWPDEPPDRTSFASLGPDENFLSDPPDRILCAMDNGFPDDTPILFKSPDGVAWLFELPDGNFLVQDGTSMADGTLTADALFSFPRNLIRPDGGFSTVLRLPDEPLVNAKLRSGLDPELPFKGLACHTEEEEWPVDNERLFCTAADGDPSELLFSSSLRFTGLLEDEVGLSDERPDGVLWQDEPPDGALPTSLVPDENLKRTSWSYSLCH
jgi:hypothetical protein